MTRRKDCLIRVKYLLTKQTKSLIKEYEILKFAWVTCRVIVCYTNIKLPYFPNTLSLEVYSEQLLL